MGRSATIGKSDTPPWPSHSVTVIIAVDKHLIAKSAWVVNTYLTSGKRPLSGVYRTCPCCCLRPAKLHVGTSPHRHCVWSSFRLECTLWHSSWREVCCSKRSKAEKQTQSTANSSDRGAATGFLSGLTKGACKGGSKKRHAPR